MGPTFRKSSFSADTFNCVEVAVDVDAVLVRNSKQPDAGTATFTHPEWDAFVRGVRLGEFDVTVA